ncbi:alpha/beta hydrolase [Pilimelia anulata]|uniref:Alpha/beta hydrolase n=1 Tax=Pilimelia anulata TaxID=53371 RepID=A0A8J3B7N3_9ACTN|nr:alpha/beta hydrolase [Pilimelia anulata]GGJ82645.1 alpha/beta hydrolase [Pilimelia anulata]
MPDGPDTIVLIHGLWVTPRSWGAWVDRYRGRGYRVLAPAYPGFEVEVEALNADPTPIERVTLPGILDHLVGIIGKLDRPPILIGHSAGGALTQILLDRGYGAAGVVLNSAPTEGVAVAPLSQLKSTFPVLRNPANRHRAVPFTPEQWHYAFANTFGEAESRELYERFHIPGPGGIVWNGVLANFQPGHQDAWVDYGNAARPPLLFLSGSEDNLMPPRIQQSNLKHYHGEGTITEIEEYAGRGHLMPVEPGWEQIADHALSWAENHTRR